MSLTAASDWAHPLLVFAVGSYLSAPCPSICWEMRTALPEGGGGPNTPSLSSSDMVKMVSHESQRRRNSFFSTPNQDGPDAPGAWARIVPRPGGKYSCSSENREYSGSDPSSRSQLATLGPRPIWLASYASPPGRDRP